MRKFYLSTTAERVCGILFAVVVSAALICLPFCLRHNPAVCILAVVGVVLVVGLLGMYAFNTARAACIYDPENRTLRVVDIRSKTIDLTKVACLETIPLKNGNLIARALLFTDAQGNNVAVVSTYFTSKNGVRAEPMAKEMARELGLEFKANVPLWQYDKEARKIHDMEEEKREKEEAKKRSEERKALREQKIRKRMEQIRKGK